MAKDHCGLRSGRGETWSCHRQAVRPAYRINDPIIGTVRYTSILPFSLAQVIVALALIGFLTLLGGPLALDKAADVTMYCSRSSSS